MENIRYGIIGCGAIAGRFARALSRSEGAVLYACAARDPKRAGEFARTHGAERAYGDYQSLIDDPRVQAVYIATVNSTHAPVACAAIGADKAVLCEKPFFTNAPEAEATLALARTRGVPVMEAFWTRCEPAYQKVRQWLQESRIGHVYLARTAFCFNMPYSGETRQSRIWNPEVGGGALLDVGVYAYQYVTGLLGRPEKVEGTVVKGPTGVDQTTSLTLTYPDGALAQCLCSVTANMDDTAILSGTEGFIRQPRFFGARRAELYDREGRLVEAFEDPEEEGFVHEIAHFTALVREGRPESDLMPLSDTLDFSRLVSRLLDC